MASVLCLKHFTGASNVYRLQVFGGWSGKPRNPYSLLLVQATFGMNIERVGKVAARKRRHHVGLRIRRRWLLFPGTGWRHETDKQAHLSGPGDLLQPKERMADGIRQLDAVMNQDSKSAFAIGSAGDPLHEPIFGFPFKRSITAKRQDGQVGCGSVECGLVTDFRQVEHGKIPKREAEFIPHFGALKQIAEKPPGEQTGGQILIRQTNLELRRHYA